MGLWRGWGEGAQAAIQRLRRAPHRTLSNKHFRIEGRKTFYKSIEQMQKDPDAFLVSYNTSRPHQSRGLKLAPNPDLSQEKREEKMPPNPKQAALSSRPQGRECQANTIFVQIY